MTGVAGTVQRFQFERRFDASGGRGDAARPGSVAVEPMFSREDLERARADGFARGRAEAVGAEEARRGAERLRQQTLDAVAAEVRSLVDAAAASAASAAEGAILVAAAVVRKLLPQRWREGAAAEIGALVRDVLAGLAEEPLITVRVAPQMTAELRSNLESAVAAGGAEARLRVVGDAAIAEGDCRIDWRDGGVSRDRQAMWRELEVVIEEALGLAVPHGAETAAVPGVGMGHG
jgi:flagellar assembly protein FliH